MIYFLPFLLAFLLATLVTIFLCKTLKEKGHNPSSVEGWLEFLSLMFSGGGPLWERLEVRKKWNNYLIERKKDQNKLNKTVSKYLKAK